jgi:isopentenyl phosphate kinase
MKELVLVKLGGSVVTDKGRKFTSRPKNISRFAKEICSASRKTNARIILGHGAGSFAHIPAAKYKTKDGLVGKDSLYGMSATEEAARWLNGIVIKKFVDEGVVVFPFSPGSFLISDTKVCSKSYLDPIKEALELGVIPVVYGDVIIDKKIGCTIFSTEKIFSILAKTLRRDYKIRIIFVTDVDGVYDEKGRIIAKITGKNFKGLTSSIVGAKSIDVTGGMLHKVEEALSIAKSTGINTLIINGKRKDLLKNAILGKKVEGTLIS